MKHVELARFGVILAELGLMKMALESAISAARAAVRYDDAIRRSVEGADLDALYGDWISKARIALRYQAAADGPASSYADEIDKVRAEQARELGPT